MSPRMFITGASGYVGSVITELAIAEGYEVCGLSRSEKNDAKLRALGAAPIRGDLTSFDVLTRSSAEADVVIHLADPVADDFAMDYNEALRIDAAAVDAIGEGLKGTNKLLIVTSGTLVVAPTGDVTTEDSPIDQKPLNGRIQAEKHDLTLCPRGVRVCVVRLAPFVYGRGGSGVRLIMNISNSAGRVIRVGDDSVKTSAVHVDDAARLYLLVAKEVKSGEVFNATSSTDVSIGEILQATASTLGLPIVSLTPKEAAASLGEFFAKFLLAENRASSEKAVGRLGWEPREIGILEDIASGSYVTAAREIHSSATA